MTPLELFKCVCRGPWETSGLAVQWRIHSEGEETWLTFQGSREATDWIADFDFPAVPYRDSRMMVHRGFLGLWRSVRDEMLARLEGVTSIHVGGYSLGGALATLALEDLKWHGHEAHGVVFGSPRVLWMPDREIKARFGALDRWAVRGDIVTVCPPAITGYIHVGTGHDIGPWNLPWWTHHRPEEYEAALGGT